MHEMGAIRYLPWPPQHGSLTSLTQVGIGSHLNAGTNKFLESQSRGLDHCIDYGRLGRAEPQNL
jgi:hypothetical protein